MGPGSGPLLASRAYLERIDDALHAAGRDLILCGARPQPAKLMRQAEFERHVGRENICPDFATALARAKAIQEGTIDSEDPASSAVAGNSEVSIEGD